MTNHLHLVRSAEAEAVADLLKRTEKVSQIIKEEVTRRLAEPDKLSRKDLGSLTRLLAKIEKRDRRRAQ